MNQLFTKNHLKNYFKKYKLAFASSFSIGVFISTIPYIYKFIENSRIEQLIQEERKMQIQKNEQICKNNNSEYRKFIKLGFPDTAISKFKICMQEK